MTIFQRRHAALAGSACLKKTNVAIEIPRIATAALSAASSLLEEWLPTGKQLGKEYWSINPARADRHAGSFSINLQNGNWHDFASGDKGGDLVSLFAYLDNCRQWDAALIIANRLGISVGTAPANRDVAQETAERQRIARERERRQQQADLAQHQRWSGAKKSANRWWHESHPADPKHPYLMRKQVKPHGLRQRGNELLVPLYHSLQLVNLQRIAPDGSKRFLAGGRVKGSYSPLGGIGENQTLYICEGWATGATLREATGSAVACAMNAGNLLEVALQLKHRYPAARLVIAGDDDRQTLGNPGRTAANAAALAVDAEVVFPDWPEGVPLALSDFNDLYCWSACHE